MYKIDRSVSFNEFPVPRPVREADVYIYHKLRLLFLTRAQHCAEPKPFLSVCKLIVGAVVCRMQ
jgi:hypothetical protein